MKKIIIIFLSIFAIIPFTQAQAQLSNETETGTDGYGEYFFSQYLFYDSSSLNYFARYFWVKDVLNRGEFALGPTLSDTTRTVKLTFGGTTDHEAIVSALYLTKIFNRDLLYLFDLKISTKEKIPNTIYQKLAFGINTQGELQLRFEHLSGGYWTKDKFDGHFFRLGFEYQFKHNLYNFNTQWYVAPFYDPLRKSFGGQMGFRFF